MKTVSIIVQGKVQGVFYRKTARSKGEELGLTGFVRNEEDGSVYIEATGDEAILEQFGEWCRKGPDRAEVTEVTMNDLPLTHYHGFSVQR